MEPISIVTLIGLILGLVGTIVKEVFSAKARAKKLGEEYVFNKAKFLEIISKATSEMRDEVARENRRIGDVDDRVDDELDKK